MIYLVKKYVDFSQKLFYNQVLSIRSSQLVYFNNSILLTNIFYLLATSTSIIYTSIFSVNNQLLFTESH